MLLYIFLIFAVNCETDSTRCEIINKFIFRSFVTVIAVNCESSLCRSFSVRARGYGT